MGEPANKNLEKRSKKRRSFIRDADDLVRRLPVEFEIELGLGPTVVPIAETLELATPQRLLRERGAPDRDAYARRLPLDTGLPRSSLSRSNDAARDEAWPALVLAREHENRVAFRDELPAVHRLLRGEHERPGPRIANLTLDRERHSPLRSEIKESYTAQYPNPVLARKLKAARTKQAAE